MSLSNDLWSAARPSAPGKFLYAGDDKLWVRGVTYGTFRPSADGALFPSPATVRRDFGFYDPAALLLFASHALSTCVTAASSCSPETPSRA